MEHVDAEREYLCGPLALSRRVHLRQLLFVELVERQLDWTDGAEQVDGCVLCTDELPLLQLAHLLADSVGTHPHCSTYGFVAGPALVGTSILAAEQVRVDSQCAG